MRGVVSPFPPSFDGNPYSYAAALFATTLIVALCLAQLLAYLFEARRNRAIDRMLNNPVAQSPLPAVSVVNVHRAIVSCFLAALILRAGPDALVMYAWGEGSVETMTILFALDRYLDTLALLPVLLALAMLAWAAQAIPQQLIRNAHVALARPRWSTFAEKLKIVSLVLLIAVGVTIGKASG